MILATDVHYFDDDTACAAVVGLSTWSASAPSFERTRSASGVAPYVAGRFFERELPCLLPLLRPIARANPHPIIVVDGYVDVAGGPGLGRHLADALANLGLACEVIGIAKTAFPGAPAVELVRGSGATPLYVSTTTTDIALAANWVRSMHGRHRLPTALVRVDHLARGLARL